MEQTNYLRRVPNPAALDYYVYTDYLTEGQIDKLVELDVYMFERSKEIMYVFANAALTRQEWFDSRGKDLALSIYKLPPGWRWRDLSASPNAIHVNLSDKELFIRGDKIDEVVDHVCKTFSLTIVNE